MVTQIVAWISSFVLGIGVVWQIFSKWSPKIRHSIEITDEVLDILRAVMTALDDRKITKRELELIMNEIEDLQELLKK